VEALRLSHLFDGKKDKELSIPPIGVFAENSYKSYDVPEIPYEDLLQIA
jgi:hypothetical protein